jgi:uncharacterized membrane protein YcaP (DUF421 family)
MIIGDLDSVIRIAIVGPLAYISLIVILRVSGKRTLSKMNAFDFVVTVALGSLLATVLLDSSVGIIEGAAAIGVLVVGQYVVSWLSARSDRIERIVKAEPTLIVSDGRPLPGAMRRMRVTRRDIEAAAREAGVDAAEVSEMILEPDGTLSVVVDDRLKNR